ncbi:MAG: L-2-amino-thiazoline-4-carboxylic acid hydrolase, partial [Acidobacteriota bacterium]|nr:L-2-amino-thiazoline-4-carboxylic acid hydrolase [Acidobacteriota bacterium]
MRSAVPEETLDAVTRLNEVGVLTRREIEARILAPVIEALGREFDRGRVIEIVRDAITSIAREQGRAIAETAGGTSLADFAGTLEPWTRDGALTIQMRAHTDDRLDF